MEAYYEQLLATGKEQRPTGLQKIVVNLPEAAGCPDDSERAEFRRQFFALVRQECSKPDPEWAKGIQGAPVRDFVGFPLLQKYLGEGAVWLKPSKWAKSQPLNWVVISPAGRAFAPGATFKL